MAQTNDPIKNIVVLMLENRSFDHLLGDLKHLSSHGAVEGIDRNHPGSNVLDSVRYEQSGDAAATLPKHLDPAHEHVNVKTQLGNLNAPDMSGFLQDAFNQLHKEFKVDQLREVMRYFPVADNPAQDVLPALRTLAQRFTVCDHWFSSLPGPTWPNRFFALCGTAAGHITMPTGLSSIGKLFTAYDMDTVFDRIRGKGLGCRIFHDGVPLSMLLRRTWRYPQIYGSLDDFEQLAHSPNVDDFPAFSFIEPNYNGGLFSSPNDQHPPHNVVNGDRLITRIYNALRANERLWNQTLLVVLYDEHGGFYDHVPPPASIAPDALQDKDAPFDFTRLGVRVPAILVSPHVRPGAIDSNIYDHTSLLAYLAQKWDFPPLGKRAAQAKSFVDSIVAGANPNAPQQLPLASPGRSRALVPQDVPLNGNQRALALMVDYLHAELKLSEPLGASTGRVRRGLDAPPEQPPSAQAVRNRSDRRAAEILNHLQSLVPDIPPAPAPLRSARALAPLKVLMIHGIGHGDADTRWQEAWQRAFRHSAAEAGFAQADKIDFAFAKFDDIFEKYPLDVLTVAKALAILGSDVLGPTPGFGRRDIQVRGITDTLRWTAGMVVQWTENPALRNALNARIMKAIQDSNADIICTHSLGGMAAYDTCRQQVALGKGAQFDGKRLITFGSQFAHPAVQRIFGGRIEPLYGRDGHGFDQWYHLYNPHDHVFTRPLPGGDARSHGIIADFDIPNDPINHDGAHYLAHPVMAATVLPVLLPHGDARMESSIRALAMPAVITTPSVRRRALLVGINDYPDPAMQLNGCVNDTYLMSAVLQECGFEADDIRLLTDRRATRDALLERLAWLTDGVKPGDERVFFYSGHGAQMPLNPTASGQGKICETLVPADFDWTLEHAFTDREFNEFYSHLPYDARFVAIFDCCHAGGMTRGGQRVRGIDPPDDIRHRGLRWEPQHQMWVPRDFVEAASRGVRPYALDADAPRHPSSHRLGLGDASEARPGSAAELNRATKRYGHKGPYLPILLYAAGKEELAAEYEHGSVSYGAFTFALCKHLRQRKDVPNFSELVRDVSTELKWLGYQQTPEVSGPHEILEKQIPIYRWKDRA